MAGNMSSLIEAAQEEFRSNDAELAFQRERQFLQIIRKSSAGSADIDVVFSLDRKYRLVFIRCHFSGGSGTASFVISIDSGLGSAYDVRLFTVTKAGTSEDVHLRIADGDAQEPSAWTFKEDDSLRIQWTNPDSGNMTWGLEVGFAIVS